MKSIEYRRFTTKLIEVEQIFLELSTKEKECAFELILTFKVKCTEAVDNSQNATYKKEKELVPKTIRCKPTHISDTKKKDVADDELPPSPVDFGNLADGPENKDYKARVRKIQKRSTCAKRPKINKNLEEDDEQPLSPVDVGNFADDPEDKDYKERVRKRKESSTCAKKPEINKNLEEDDEQPPSPVDFVNFADEASTLYSCTDCFETFTHSVSYFEHVTSHGHCPRSCRNCMKEFVTSEEFDCHFCTRSEYKKCKFCKNKTVRFVTTKLLRKHIEAIHPNEIDRQQFDCRFCNFSYFSKQRLYQHMKKYHADGKECCSFCLQFFNDNESLQEHMMKTHKEEINFICEKCGKGFKNAGQYDHHSLEHLKCDCTMCPEKFDTRAKLVLHYKLDHDTIVSTMLAKQMYPCDECDKTFDRPSELLIHQRVHTGEGLLECKPCERIFRNTIALMKHKQTDYHNMRDVKERKFVCSKCGKGFFSKVQLKQHMKTHTGVKPYKCKYCGYRFRLKQQYDMHLLYKHTDSREFTCEICSFSVKDKYALKHHLATHSTEKKYKCWCGAAFKTDATRKRHLQNVHDGVKRKKQKKKSSHFRDRSSKSPKNKRKERKSYKTTQKAISSKFFRDSKSNKR